MQQRPLGWRSGYTDWGVAICPAERGQRAGDLPICNDKQKMPGTKVLASTGGWCNPLKMTLTHLGVGQKIAT